MICYMPQVNNVEDYFILYGDGVDVGVCELPYKYVNTSYFNC